MGQLHLKATFRRGCALAKDLQDQAGAVDHLALQLFLKVALLDRGQRTVDDHQFGSLTVAGHGDVVDLALAEQGAGPRLADRDGEGFHHHDPDCQSQAPRLFKPAFGIHGDALPHRRIDDDGPRPAGNLTLEVVVVDQSASSSSSSSPPVRSTGVTGWIVDTACL